MRCISLPSPPWRLPLGPGLHPGFRSAAARPFTSRRVFTPAPLTVVHPLSSTTVVEERSPYFEPLAARALGLLAVFYLFLYVLVALLRMGYPYELEFLEGTSIGLIDRIVSPAPLYVRPTLEFIPSNYTPLYYYLSAGLAAVTGVGFLPLRLLSFLSSLACFGLIFLLVRRETASRYFGVLAAGLFAASYGVVGAWFDLGRNDSLFLALMLWGVYLVRFRPEAPWTIAAAAVITLAFLTKQTAAMIAPALVLWTLLANRRQFVVLSLSLAVLVGTSCLVLNWLYDGWFNYYVFKIAGLHPFTRTGFVTFWKGEMLPFYTLSFALALFYFCRSWFMASSAPLLFYLLLLGAMVGSSWMVRSHEGAYVNVLMPACAALAVLFALGMEAALRAFLEQGPQSARAWVYLLGLAQFMILFYSPWSLVPSGEDRLTGDEFVRRLAAMPGEVWLPQHNYLAPRAGKKAYANAITIWDVTADPAQKEGPGTLQAEIMGALRSRRFQAILFGVDPAGVPVSKPGFVDQFYRPAGQILSGANPAAFRPITGTKSRPELIYLPR